MQKHDCHKITPRGEKNFGGLFQNKRPMICNINDLKSTYNKSSLHKYTSCRMDIKEAENV